MGQPAAVLLSDAVVVRTGATAEEYMAFENETDERHEFHNGDIIAMPGNTSFHEELLIHLAAIIVQQVRGIAKVYGSNLKTMIPTYNRFVYPDLTIVRGEGEFRDAARRELLNPTVICEVLSPSTAEYDLTQKFEYYRSIPSLEEIAFFAQDRASAELFRKDESGRWHVIELAGGVVEFASVQAKVRLADLYA